VRLSRTDISQVFVVLDAFGHMEPPPSCWSWRLDQYLNSTWAIRRPAPGLGEHNPEVFGSA
jgi:hypothetical protein